MFMGSDYLLRRMSLFNSFMPRRDVGSHTGLVNKANCSVFWSVGVGNRLATGGKGGMLVCGSF